jgi:transcriptional regulator with XRE-family HTH domain
MNFGEFFKTKRRESQLTLRQFCVNSSQDAAYISRLENGLMAAPSSPDKLKGLAKALNITQDSEEWVTFFDLAATSRHDIPADIALDSEKALELLPAFYRTLRNQPLSAEEAERLLKLIKGGPHDSEPK